MFALLLISQVAADLPVHCLRHQVAGDWTFSLSETSSTRSRCGHMTPDVPASQPSTDDSAYKNQMHVMLDAPSTAMADGMSGSWSMVYDEGFEVRVGSKSFFAFNSFDGSISADGNVKNYKSDCSKTQVGWFTDGDQYGCFTATKSGGAKKADFISQSFEAFTTAAPVEFNMDSIFGTNSQPSLIQEHVYTKEEHQAHVDRINSKQSSWTATVYDHLLNKTHRELNTMSGIRRAGVQKLNVKAAKPVPSFLQVSRVQEMVKSMPTDFDWRNKDGKDYLPTPVNQGSCGSCYVISSITMLSARRKILEDNVDAEKFSAQFPLFCSEFNQGCDGGYPELVAKWSHDVALVPESCGAYDLGEQSCKLSCDPESTEKYKVGEYGYIGGFYGASNEGNMMEEIYNRGPIAVAIEPNDDFMYYNNGVYEHAGAIFQEGEWTRVDHAVLITGWGEDNGKAYWRIQNSWGKDWGEEGTVRIKRGTDESAVEAQAVFGTVEKTSDPSALRSYA